MPRITLFCLLAALLLQGCASSTTSSSNASTFPPWIANPEKTGYLSVVGSAPRQDIGGIQAQYRVAMMKARQELAQMVRVQVESTTKIRVEDRSGKVTSDTDIESRLRSNTELNLDEARVIEEWTDPQSGELYIWLAIPK